MKKKKIIFVSILHYFVQQIAAQNNVYFKPVLETKASTSYYYEKKSKSTEYFQFEKQNISYPHKLSPTNFGILFGYEFSNKGIIEMGIIQDVAISGYNLYFQTKEFDYFTDNYISSKSGTAGIKVPLLLTLKVFSSDSIQKHNKLKFSLEMLLGVSYFHQPKGNSLAPVTTFGQDSIEVAQDVFMFYKDATYSIGNKSFLYTIGFSSEICYKNHKIANLTIYYQYGRKDLSSQTIDININNQTKYHYNVFSRGSGFVLQLSRKIYWTDFSKKHNRNKNNQPITVST